MRDQVNNCTKPWLRCRWGEGISRLFISVPAVTRPPPSSCCVSCVAGGAGRGGVAIQQQLWRENTQPSSSGGRGREVRVYTRRAPGAGDHTSLGHHTSLHTLARGVPPSIVGRPIVFICPRTSKEKPVPPFFFRK